MVDAEKDIEEYKKDWFSKVGEDSLNIFTIAEESLEAHSNIESVIIVKKLPRYDRSRDALSGIKSQLSQYANSVYNQVWLKKGCPKNIYFVDIELGTESSKYLRRLIYGKSNRNDYDGIHLRGEGAARHFTYRAIKAMNSIISGKVNYPGAQHRTKDYTAKHSNYHTTTCPQAQYQKRQTATNQQTGYSSDNQSQRQSGVNSQARRYSDVVDNRYSVPTGNRFSPLN